MTELDKQNTPAITGLGCISPLGSGLEAQVEAMRDDRVGLGPFHAMEQARAGAEQGLAGGECSDLDDVPLHERAARGLGLTVRQALADAGVDHSQPPYPASRIAAVLGTSLHGMNAAGAWLRGEPATRFRWFQAGHVLEHALADLPVGGARVSCSSACASAVSSIGHARTLLETGAADLVICGGYDPVSEYSVAGFHALRVVSTQGLRPFAADRDGMQVSEGYAVMVLERFADARKRNQRVHALITGLGESSDAHHLTQPMPEGQGAAAVLADALRESGATPGEVGLMVAHATGTRDNDAAEALAVRQVLGNDGPPVVAIKSRVGHTLGAAGALDAIIVRACVDAGVMPTTARVTDGQVGEPIRLATGAPGPLAEPNRHIVSCSLGFGGANAAMVQPSPDAGQTTGSQARRPSVTHDVALVGIGYVLPAAMGEGCPTRDTLWQSGVVDPATLKPHLPRAKARRLSPLARLTLVATQFAIADAGIDADRLPGLDAPPHERPACLVASTNGSASYAYDYYREMVEQGYAVANPLLFAEGVPNAPAAHVSMFHRLHGTSQSIIGTHTAGIDALSLATQRIASGRWTTAIVCIAEEDHPLLRTIVGGCGYIAEDAPPGEGAIALVLQRSSTEGDAAPRNHYARLHRPQHVSTNSPADTLARWLDDDTTTRLSATDLRQHRALTGAGRELLPHGPWFALASGQAMLHALAQPSPGDCRIAAGCPTGLVSGLTMSV